MPKLLTTETGVPRASAKGSAAGQ